MSDPVSPYSHPQEASRPRVWSMRPRAAVLWLLLVALVFGSCGLVAGRLGGGKSEDGPANLREKLVDGEKKAEKKIAMIIVEGMIMETMGSGGSVSKVSNALKAIEKDPNLVGVLLAIDTPGGGVTASDRIYHDLMEFKARTKLPVHAMFYDVAASGGYYVAMAADHITAHPTGITGSIGVISKFYNVSEAMDKVGVSVNVVKSLNSKGEVSYKDIGSPFRPMTREERALIQGLITEMWERFTEVVAAGREGKMTPEKVREVADGRVFTGNQALAVGLVDAVGYKEDAYRVLREAAQAPEAKIVTYQKEPGLKEMLGLDSGLLTPPDASLGSQALRLLSEQGGFLYLWTAGSFSATP
jgi:protease-4